MALIQTPKFYIHDGTANEALQTFTIEVPKKPWRVLQYAYYVQGAAAALTNALQAKLTKSGNGASFANVNINAPVFSSGTANTGAGTVAAFTFCTHLEWTVRSAVATPNQFILVVGFWDV